jgi:hypothetical protein
MATVLICYSPKNISPENNLPGLFVKGISFRPQKITPM